MPQVRSAPHAPHVAGGPPAAARQAYRPSRTGWVLLLALLLIALVPSAGIAILDNHADESRRAEILLGVVLSEMHLQSALEWEAVSEGTLEPEGVARVAEGKRVLARTLDELTRLDPDGSALGEVRAAYGVYAAALDEQLALLAGGRVNEAEAVDAALVTPSFVVLNDAIAGATARYAQRAGERERWANGGALAALAVAALMAGALFWYWQRERLRLERRLAHQAYHDALTDLPNRALFLERLDAALVGTRRTPEALAVLFLDLDGFKHVNDSLGHAVGDQLLVAVARRLETVVRPGDTVARLGGDEFIMLLEGIADRRDATATADRVTGALAAAYALAGREVAVTCSIGIVLCDAASTYQHADDMVRDADVALYRAKAAGKARYAVYEERTSSGGASHLDREAALREAVTRGQFVVHYQPEIDFQTGQIVGTEALVRWQHPERGLVFPGDFIPLAEETGLILPIGAWVLEEACRQTKAWQERYPSAPPLTVHVNLSVRQFGHPDLVNDVRRVLRETRLPPECLVLELTESVLMGESEAHLRTLGRLKELGIRLAIDDFGTGYSSLSYLKRFPVDILKIDKSFVDGLGEDPEDTAIVQAVITLAETLGLEVIAEGVEHADQHRRLQGLGCTFGQGYYFSKPLPPEAAAALLDAGPVASRPRLTLVGRHTA